MDATDTDTAGAAAAVSEALWWRGIGFWYNDRAYLEAVDAWDRALGGADGEEEAEGEPEETAEIATEWDEVTPAAAYAAAAAAAAGLPQFRAALAVYARQHAKATDADTDTEGATRRACRLRLFLAGCHLDAGRHRAARRHLRGCLRSCRCGHGRDNSAAGCAVRVVQEYLASLEEDPTTVAAHCSLARRVLGAVRATATLPPRLREHWEDPYLRPGFIHPGIASRPWYDDGGDGGDPTRDARPAWCHAVLEDSTHFRCIQMECKRLLAAPNDGSGASSHGAVLHPVGAGSHRDGAGARDGRVVSRGSWRELVLFGAGECRCRACVAEETADGAADEPPRDDDVEAPLRHPLAPQTRRLLRRHAPEAVDLARRGGGEVVLSVLAPGTRVAVHCGPTNLRLTAHLPLVVPPPVEGADRTAGSGRCRIRVGSHWREWREGQVLVFDDAYEHEVENDTDGIRVVLLIRFWHPNLPVAERGCALAAALARKEQDVLERCNPPLPVRLPRVRDRALERSHCHHCGHAGYESLRLLEPGRFACACGHEVR